jgi:putative glutamine amidotransferase
MTTPPRVGVTLDLDGPSGEYRLARAYADAIAAAGGLPVPLPCGDAAAARAYLALCDAVVVTGGAFDIAPERYGEARRPACGPEKRERAAFEWALGEAALTRRVAFLGICGGMQLLNVLRGGSLHQDLRADLGLDGHEQPAPKDAPHHAVEIAAGSLLARLVGAEPLRVNSTHHQAVKALGAGVAASARAPDGVVEAIEVAELPFALGVQWHPERGARHDARHLGLFHGLVRAAGAARR